MAHKLVKLLTDAEGNKVEKPVWHLSIDYADSSNSTLCTMEVYGYGESSVKYETKIVNKGVQCEKCRSIIKVFKSIKL